MSFLDMKTVIFTHVLTNTVCAVVMLVLWYRNRRHFSGLSFWVAGSVLESAALLLIVSRGSVPETLSVVLGNTFLIAGILAIYMGLERFVGKNGPQVHNYIFVGLFICVHTYFFSIQPNLIARSVNASVGIFILTFQCMWLLFKRVDPGLRQIARGPGMVFAGYCLVSLVRAIIMLSGPQPGSDYLRSGTMEVLLLLSYQILFIILTFSLVLMVSRRLLAEIMVQEEKFTKAFNSSPYAISLTRLSDGRIWEVNRGFVNISGYGYDEVIGKTTLDLNLWVREEDRLAAVDKLMKRGKILESEFQFRKKAGEIMTGLFSADIIAINDEKYILSSLSDVTERKRAEEERRRLVHELQDALASVRKLSGLLPICSVCKKIRDDKGYWTQIESYVRSHSEADFSHGICPDCARKLYPDVNPYDPDEDSERVG